MDLCVSLFFGLWCFLMSVVYILVFLIFGFGDFGMWLAGCPANGSAGLARPKALSPLPRGVRRVFVDIVDFSPNSACTMGFWWSTRVPCMALGCQRSGGHLKS